LLDKCQELNRKYCGHFMNNLKSNSFDLETTHAGKGLLVEESPFVSTGQDFRVRYNKILGKFKREKYDDALVLIQRSEKKYPKSPELWQLKALILQSKNKREEAANAFQKVVELQPERASNYTNLGLAFEKMEKLDEAIIQYEKAIATDPNFATGHYNLGCVLSAKNDFASAIGYFKSALSLKPDFVQALIGLGRALEHEGMKNEGMKCYNLALKYSPQSYEPKFNLGLIEKTQGNFENAVRIFSELADEYPDRPRAKFFLAETLNKIGREKEALTVLEGLLESEAGSINYLYEAALSCRGIKRYAEAKSYLDKMLEREPLNVAAHNLYAIIEQELGNQAESSKRFEEALELSPEMAPVLNNLGLTFFEQNELDKAIENYTKAFQKAGSGFENQKTKDLAISGIYYAASKMCDWAKTAVIEKQFPDFAMNSETPTPFVLLRFDDDPEKQLIRAKNYKKSRKPIKGFSKEDFVKPDISARIKVGYFGADFHDHATMWLMSGLLRNHDKNKFEIHVFSYGKIKEGEGRELARKFADGFYDIESEKDEAVLKLARDIGLDIAIDLKGFTRETRSELFSNYLAPVQINYLGYPNTMGASHMDYLVADEVIIPKEYKEFYTEKILYLPDSYQPNDDKRVIAQTGLTRRDLGVEQDSFLFCCLNASYKITRAEYNIWMRVLSQVENSKLMLLRSNKWANKNLLIEAEKRGIDESRIILVPHLEHGRHLERLVLADLFLDTFHVNAHTTASDALWAGVPVITKIGQQFAARVAASLLYAVDMPELVAQTDEEYEALIMKFATDKQQLIKVKEKLQANRLTTALFDTERYTRNFEAGLTAAWQAFCKGETTRDIQIGQLGK